MGDLKLPVQEIENKLNHQIVITRSLLKASQSVIECEDFESAARVIFDACREATGAVSGYVALMSPTGDENEVLFLEDGGMPCSVDPELPMPIRGLREEAYRNAKVVYDNEFMNSEWMGFIPSGHVELKNVLFSPLVIDGIVVGVLGIANKPGDFTSGDAEIAAAFGEQAAMALRKTRDRELLKKSRERFDLAMNASLDGIFDLNTETDEVYLSPSLKNMLGYKNSELENSMSALESLIHTDDLPILRKMHQDLVTGKRERSEIELRMKHKGGLSLDILVRSRVYIDENGKNTRVVGTHTDISSQKMAEHELELNKIDLEEMVKAKTENLDERERELEKFNKLFIERELKIKKLQSEIDNLKK